MSLSGPLIYRPGALCIESWRVPGEVVAVHIDDAVQEQIDSTLEKAIVRLRHDLPQGESLEFCEQCETLIPQARRKAIPGRCLCVKCQQEGNLHKSTFSEYNLRESRDNQLK